MHSVVRVFAMGFLLAVVAACGGGGGSSGSGGGGSPRPDVALPDTATARQKVLTPDNSKRAVMLALNTIGFIEGGWIQASPAVDFFADSFTGLAGSKFARAVRPAAKLVDVSDRVCRSGSAYAEGGESLIGVMTQSYRNCDTGTGILDGELQLDIRSYVSTSLFSDVTYTFRGLRITTTDEDTVVDGVIVMTTSFPGAGFVAADLDIRDLTALKGMRVAGYRADFDISYSNGNDGDYIYLVRHLQGRIYDDQNEYFDLGQTPGYEPWPMLLGNNSSLTLSPSGIAAPFQIKIALDSDGDSAFEYQSFTDTEGLAVNQANNHAPEFYLDDATIRLDKGQTRKVAFGVIDADQQFVKISAELVAKPNGSDPVFGPSGNGFVFSSTVTGDYRVSVTASDGQHIVSRDVSVRVMYDPPQIAVNEPVGVSPASSVTFPVTVLNPGEGSIQVAPYAIPGLSYDATSGMATYTPLLPEFGSVQKIDLMFIVSNEDHRQVFTTEAWVSSDPQSTVPAIISSSMDRSWENNSREWLGQFTSDSSKEVVKNRWPILDLYEIDGSTLQYRESFDIGTKFGVNGMTILGVGDLDDDGFDEVIFMVASDATQPVVGVFDVKRRKIRRTAAVPGVQAYYAYSNNASVVDIDGDGYKEVVIFTYTKIYVFDFEFNLRWSSPVGNYGSGLVVANVDGDPALEIITNFGHVVDGATLLWETKRDFIGWDWMFSADVDGDGVSEIFSADSYSLGHETLLRQMTVAGQIEFDLGVTVITSGTAVDVDSDGNDEIVFFACEELQTLDICAWGRGSWSLSYVDFASGVPSVHKVGDVSLIWQNSNTLIVEGVGGEIGYVGLPFLENGSALSGFDYQQGNTSSLQYLSDSGVRLVGSLHSGDSISAAGDKLIFCGEFNSSDEVPKYDLFTVGPDSLSFGVDLTANPQSADFILSPGVPTCESAHLEGDAGDYVLSMASGYIPSSGNQYAKAVKIQRADTGEAVFVKTLPDTLGMWTGIGDADGNGTSEFVTAGYRQMQAFDVASGELIWSFDDQAQSEYVIRDFVIGDVFPGNSKDEIVLRTNSRLILLENNGNGGLSVISTRRVIDMETTQLLIADVNGDGYNDIISGGASSVWGSSPQWDFEVLDATMDVVSTWSVTGAVDAIESWRGVGGSSILVMLQRQDQAGSTTSLVWRDGFTGKSIYESPKLDGGSSKLSLFVDSVTAKMRAVINTGSRIYITQ